MPLPPRREKSYAWACHLEGANTASLTPPALEGLEWAIQLAEQHRARGRDFGIGIQRMTEADIVEMENVPAAIVRDRIALARHELFGMLSDSQIYRRSQNRKREGDPQLCLEPGCTTRIPPRPAGKPGRSQLYCAEHRAGAVRVRRHRRLPKV